MEPSLLAGGANVRRGRKFWYVDSAHGAFNTGDEMKNPLESLTTTIILGVAATVIVVLLVLAIT